MGRRINGFQRINNIYICVRVQYLKVKKKWFPTHRPQKTDSLFICDIHYYDYDSCVCVCVRHYVLCVYTYFSHVFSR